MSNILNKMTVRLGIGDTQTIKKSEEFLRSLQTKGSLKTLNDNAKPILCLNLAANLMGISFDQEVAIKLSGLNKSTYRNNLRILQNLLASDKPLTISELCVRLGCTVVKELAEELLDKYKTIDSKVKDFNHPQYVATVVYIACKIKKIKIEKSLCIEASTLKPTQWKELLKEIENFATSYKIGSSRKNVEGHLKNTLETLVTDTENDITDDKRKDLVKEVEYDVWKKKILDEAYAALDMEKMAVETL